MRLVKQEDPLGCGVACVASILRINYQDSLALFDDGKKKAQEKGVLCKEIVIALKREGLEFEYRYLKNRYKIYRPKTIVFVKRSRRYPAGHYLLKTKRGWMDPWINFPNENTKAGFRRRLPGKPIYAIYEI